MENIFADIEDNVYLRIRIRTMIRFNELVKQKVGNVIETRYKELEQLLESEKITEQKVNEFKEIILSGITEDMRREITSQLPDILIDEIQQISDQFAEMFKTASERAVNDIMQHFNKFK